MPNWNYNDLLLNHKDKEMINRVFNCIENKSFFDEFAEVPKGLKTMEQMSELFFYNHEYYEEIEGTVKILNLKYFGFSSAHEWRIKNWGTKWEPDCSVYTLIDENSIKLNFDTAWSPPTDFYKRMVEDHGFDVLAYYYEPGMMFCGQFEGVDGEVIQDEHFDIKENSVEWIKKNIPEEIDNAFGICDELDQYDTDIEEIE